VSAQRNLALATEALVSGKGDRLEECRISLESTVTQVRAEIDGGIAQPEVFQTLKQACGYIQALLQHAQEYYGGLAQVLAIQRGGYSSSGSVQLPAVPSGRSVDVHG
jgi:hypothetical protein